MLTDAWFVKEGDWTYTVIDDKVGLDEDGQQVFSTCKDGAEMWLPLLEKAYAKLHGCYAAIKMGWAYEAMIDLTGCPYLTVRVDDPDVQDDHRSGALGGGNDIEKGHHTIEEACQRALACDSSPRGSLLPFSGASRSPQG